MRLRRSVSTARAPARVHATFLKGRSDEGFKNFPPRVVGLVRELGEDVGESVAVCKIVEPLG